MPRNAIFSNLDANFSVELLIIQRELERDLARAGMKFLIRLAILRPF